MASASYTCDGCDGTSGASDSHGPGPRYAVAHAPSHGTPCPSPPRTIVSLPAASPNRSGRISACIQRWIGASSSVATAAPVIVPPTTASDSS